MKINFLTGSKEEFFDFVGPISKNDKIGVLTHNDLDGIASAVFIHEFLKSRGLEIGFIDFLEYGKGMFGKKIPELKKNKITRLFLTDLSEESDENGLKELFQKFDCFLVDHHPSNFKGGNRIKTETEDCAAITLYRLGEGILDYKKWNWLVCATIISEMSYKKKENLEFVQKIYPGVTIENIHNSLPGEIAKKITSATIYFERNLKKVYELVLEGKIAEFEKIEREVNKLIDGLIKEYHERAEFYPRKNMYFYLFKRELGKAASIVSTIISDSERDKAFVLASYRGENIKISARNQSGNVDVRELLKKGTRGLDSVVAGGHTKASGAAIRKADLEKFKENLLN